MLLYKKMLLMTFGTTLVTVVLGKKWDELLSTGSG